MGNVDVSDTLGKVAVIGMTCRVPGARSPEQFWENLCDGKETITFFSDDELLAEGYSPRALSMPNFVRAGGVYEGTYLFDASFFGYTPREAELIDPQHRIFLECAWETLERSGYDPGTYQGRIGVFGGAGAANHFVALFNDPAVRASVNSMALFTSNDKDYLATRVGYKLNLRGPCVTVQTACSTSLVAIILGAQSLLNYQSDIVLAGGVTINTTEKTGYMYQEGGIVSPDGHCRPFDSAAKGTIFSSGQGMVALKRLQDALKDGDQIHAVIIGFGMNNDGSAKVGFTAPSVDGQAAVSSEALAMAGISPETIGYVECHGTATPVGDPIEIAALTKAFRAHTRKTGFCAVGSVKSNLGHTDAAAGVTGFIKTVLSLEQKKIPPTLHFERPNPEIDFDNSPFYPNSTLRDWAPGDSPRRAGLNSFGIGGTNAHVILEEAPPAKVAPSDRPWHLLVWSAKSAAALEEMTANLTSYLSGDNVAPIADIAHTLLAGRAVFPFRRVLACRNTKDALDALQNRADRVLSVSDGNLGSPVVFLFPGQGTQYVQMAREIYHAESTFQQNLDLCAKVAQPHLGYDIRDILYASENAIEEAAARLGSTGNTQPALFIIEYCLAKLWLNWGVHPSAMIGHSIGEYVAACLADVFSLEDAIRLVVARGALMQDLPRGAMLGVEMTEREIRARIASRPRLSIAAINAPSTCVVSGPEVDISELEGSLAPEGVPYRRLHTSHAFHSAMMDPILDPFQSIVESITLRPPSIPFVSNLTGRWITAAEATTPNYWVSHLRSTVRFSAGAELLLNEEKRVWIEVGPGRVLGSLIGRHRRNGLVPTVIPSLPGPQEASQDAEQFLLNAAGAAWLNGAPLNFAALYRGENRSRVVLPTYPFERQTYRLLPSGGQKQAKTAERKAETIEKKSDIADWFYHPSWKRVAPLQPKQPESEGAWVLFVDAYGLGQRVADRLRRQGQDVICISPQQRYHAQVEDRQFGIDPANRDHYVAVLAELRRSSVTPTHFVHFWGITDGQTSELDCLEQSLHTGFYSLMSLAQAIGYQQDSGEKHLHVVTNNLHDVAGEPVFLPSRAALLGPARVISREYRHIRAHVLDIDINDLKASTEGLVDRLLTEFAHSSREETVAYRGSHRWLPIFEEFKLNAVEPEVVLRERGVYLVTGGLGGIGLVMANYLASNLHAQLALVGRSHFPDRGLWDEWLSTHPSDDRTSQKIRGILDMESSGARVLVFSADVANPHQMFDTVRRVRAEFGEINGVIHAAGVPGNGVIDLKTHEIAHEVLAPKIHGTLVLDEIFKDTPLDFFLLCSSLTAFFGAAGQSDYTGANAFQDAYAHSRKGLRPYQPISINWDRWNEVGMAVAALRGELNHTPMAEGELRGPYETLSHPVFVGRYQKGGNIGVFGHLTADHWIVGEHKIMGVPTLVGTAYLELARSAFAFVSNGTAAELRDVVFLSPLVLRNGEKKEIEVGLIPSAGDDYEFRIKSRTDVAAAWTDHAIGKIRHLPSASREGERISVDTLVKEANVSFEANALPTISPENGVVQVGERWNSIIGIGEQLGQPVGVFELPGQVTADLDQFALHPALLDCATAFGLVGRKHTSLYLPANYDRLRFYKPFGPKIYSRAKSTTDAVPNPEVLTLDLDIFSEDGELLAEVAGYGLKRVPEAILRSWDSRSAKETSSDRSKEVFAPGEWGILSGEGVEVCLRALSLRTTPQVAIATTDLNGILARMRASAEGHQEIASKAATLGLTHPRPELATPYAAPRTELEEKIAEIWRQVLGIDKVGIYDTFMDLRGDSLMAVQVASQIREVFEIELPVARFYKNPTVVGLAEAIVQTLASQLDSDVLAEALRDVQSDGEGVRAATAGAPQ